MADRFEGTAVKLSQGPLGIIALFIVLIHAFASLVIGLAPDIGATNRSVLVWFIVLFPVVVLAVFAWLVSCHYVKLYPPQAYRQERYFRDLAVYGNARFDRGKESAGQKLPVPPNQVLTRATGSLYWLGHDLMWTADVLLRGGEPKDTRIGLDQALHHLAEVGLGQTPIAGELRRLQELIQETPVLPPSLRDAYATELGSIIDQIGAAAEAAQADFRVPPHWSRVRSSGRASK